MRSTKKRCVASVAATCRRRAHQLVVAAEGRGVGVLRLRLIIGLRVRRRARRTALGPVAPEVVDVVEALAVSFLATLNGCGEGIGAGA